VLVPLVAWPSCLACTSCALNPLLGLQVLRQKGPQREAGRDTTDGSRRLQLLLVRHATGGSGLPSHGTGNSANTYVCALPRGDACSHMRCLGWTHNVGCRELPPPTATTGLLWWLPVLQLLLLQLLLLLCSSLWCS
jgi:hypothetical protein